MQTNWGAKNTKYPQNFRLRRLGSDKNFDYDFFEVIKSLLEDAHMNALKPKAFELFQFPTYYLLKPDLYPVI